MHDLLAGMKSGVDKAVASIRQRSLLIPTLVSFLSFIVAVLLIISVWFTGGVIGTLEESLQENASISSVKAAGMLESAFQDIVDTAIHLKTVVELSPRSFREDPYISFKMIRHFNSGRYSNLVLCYDNSPRLLTLYGTCSAEVLFPEVDGPRLMVDTLQQTDSVGLTSTGMFGAPWGSSRLLMYYPLNSQYTAVFILNASRMNSIISAAIDSTDGLQVLYGRDGNVLWASRPLEDEVQARLLAGMTGSASGDRITLNGTDYIFSVNSVGFDAKLVVLEKITTQFDTLRTIISMLIIICVAILALGVLFLLYSVNKSYKPIANLVRDLRTVLPEQQEGSSSDIAMLRNAYSRYSALLQESQKNAALFSPDQLRNLFVLRTISGRYTDADELYNLSQWLQIDFPHPCFFACLMLFDGVRTEQDRRDVESFLYYECQEMYHSYFYLLPDGRSAVGIVNVPSDDPAQLSRFGETMLAQLPESQRATLGVGQIYPDIASLGKSYLEAHAALDYRLIKGKNTWITYSEISFAETAPMYPHQLINSYVNTVRTWNVQGIREKLQQITDYIYANNLPLQQVKCICFDLTSAFLREISSLDKHVTYKPNNAYDVFNIAEYDSVTELAQKIASFSENIQQYMAKQNEYQAVDMVRQCEEYMRENISNVQFSLSSCAERFDIAQQTLRRKFKEATGQTLSSYMTALRIDHAKQLLTTTDMDINEVCEQCGYLDLSSFIRLFKSETGVSPGKYRETYRQGNPSGT